MIERIQHHAGDIAGAATSLAFCGIGLAQINEALTAVALLISITAGAVTLWHKFRK